MITPIYSNKGFATKRSNIERKNIYLTLVKIGFSTSMSRRMRDWTYNHIKIQLKLNRKQRLFSKIYRELKNAELSQ